MCRTLNCEGLHPRQHSFLAVATQIDVGPEVVAVAQVFVEPDERVGAVLRDVRVLAQRAFVQHPANRGGPVGDDLIEVAIDYVGGGAA